MIRRRLLPLFLALLLCLPQRGEAWGVTGHAMVADIAEHHLTPAALDQVHQLLREEGLFLGLSSGINIAGAVKYAIECGSGQTIVTVLCDSGLKYQSKLFNAGWLAEHELYTDRPIESVLEE